MEASVTTPKQTTVYVVLEQREATSPGEAAERQANIYYVEAERIEARSARDAVAKYVRTNKIEAGGKFIAIPVRSFQPVTVKTETQTRITFS